MADPKVVLAERGLEVPAGMDVTVVENNDNTIHITSGHTVHAITKYATKGGQCPA